MSHIDAADYLLGMLPADLMEQGRAREREDPAFAAEVRELRTVVGRLDAVEADEWEPVTPPPLRVGEITAGAAPAAAPARRRGWLQRIADRASAPTLAVRPGLAAIAAALLLVAGVGAGVLLSRSGSSSAPVVAARVPLEPIGAGPATAHGVAALETASGAHEVTLEVRNLAPNAKGTYYEVWMARDARHMVSLGTFDVGASGRARVTLPVPVSPAAYPVMDVSLERADGNPGHGAVSVLRSPGARLS
jgi:anti-sigma-K factor RskA